MGKIAYLPIRDCQCVKEEKQLKFRTKNEVSHHINGRFWFGKGFFAF